MKHGLSDYSLYLPPSPKFAGIQATSAGYTFIKPGSPYPPGRHPADHLLDWQSGRVLQDLQIVYISEGGGVFHSEATGEKTIYHGTFFLLLPGVRHRYRPNAASGWTEHWIELHGEPVQEMLQAHDFRPEMCVMPQVDPWLADCFGQVHAYATALHNGAQETLSSLGLHMLTHLLYRLHQPDLADTQRDHDIQMVCGMMTRQIHQPLGVAELAEKLGMSQPSFRKEFRKRTRMSPKHYHRHLRIRKAQELLQNPDLKLQQIANALGYHSAFHFSADFKKEIGRSPQHWREQIFTTKYEHDAADTRQNRPSS